MTPPPIQRDITPQQAVANNALLDLVAARVIAYSDRQLAKVLQSNAPVISRIRNGKMEIGPTLQVAMLEYGGVDLETIRRYVPEQRHSRGASGANL